MSQPSIITQAIAHGDAIAIRSSAGQVSYRQLLDQSVGVAAALLDGQRDLDEARIGFLVPAGASYVATQWGIWRAGGIAVPLSKSATQAELEYALTDSGAECVVTCDPLVDPLVPVCKRLDIALIQLERVRSVDSFDLPDIGPQRSAMMLYTSGTTNRPKGVVSTHANIEAQINALIAAWRWQSDDQIPLFLPLHHIHGIINVMSCALWIGASFEPFQKFDMDAILDRVAAGAYSVFMAVPTIYVKLIQRLESIPASERSPIIDGFAGMRLMVSGSAALPATVHAAWTELTSQKLLERYGMTEIGMALSNPYHGQRRPGAVGQPLPGVEVRLVDESGAVLGGQQRPGEIQVRGPAVFAQYWNRPESTAESFVDGWFKTGDMAVLEDGYYRIMGRLSVDIIKSGGYKLSALEIESVLLEHPDITECAVVPVADDTWGEVVAAVVVAKRAATLDLQLLRQWCGDKLSAYKLPKRLLLVEQLPRNAMGKVTKPAVVQLFSD